MKKFINILLFIVLLVFCTGCSIFGDLHVHTFDNSSTSASVINKCTHEGCNVGKMPDRPQNYDEAIKYNFDEKVVTKMKEIEEELVALIHESETSSESELLELGDAAKSLFSEYERLYDTVVAQYQYAYLQHDINSNIKNTNRYEKMNKYQTELNVDYYKILYLLYKSKLKDFVLRTHTMQDFASIEREYQASLNEELVTLNEELLDLQIQAEQNRLFETSQIVADLYGQMVEKNNQIAKIYKYNSYIEYAYETIYMRDYNYKDSLEFNKKVDQIIVPLYSEIINKYNALADEEISEETYAYYDSIMWSSFFNNVIANKTVNDYMLKISDGNKLNFKERFENLFIEGNYYLGSYEGAYEWYIPSFEKPIIFWGPGYRGPFTVVHEFGHYMDDITYLDEYKSFDLLETHSQGNELLYLSYLKEILPQDAFELVEIEMLLYFLENIIISSAVNVFEIAVYKNEYTGIDSAKYLSDKKITSDEYDDLFKSILKDYDLNDYGYDSYWRYATIFNPCYYISYSTSAVASLQIYAKSNLEGFNSAKDSYTKLYTYYDLNKEYTYKQVLEFAGLYHYNDEKAFQLIKEKLYVG